MPPEAVPDPRGGPSHEMSQYYPLPQREKRVRKGKGHLYFLFVVSFFVVFLVSGVFVGVFGHLKHVTVKGRSWPL